MSIFLSYSREDNLSAVTLEAELEAAGLNVFRDPPLLAGDPFWRERVATQHLELRFVTVAPEPDIELVCSNTKVEHRQVRQPLRQPRIDAQLSSRCIRDEPQHGLHQREDRACRPSLRYVGSEVLDGETSFVALDRRIELRQLVE